MGTEGTVWVSWPYRHLCLCCSQKRVSSRADPGSCQALAGHHKLRVARSLLQAAAALLPGHLVCGPEDAASGDPGSSLVYVGCHSLSALGSECGWGGLKCAGTEAPVVSPGLHGAGETLVGHCLRGVSSLLCRTCSGMASLCRRPPVGERASLLHTPPPDSPSLWERALETHPELGVSVPGPAYAACVYVQPEHVRPQPLWLRGWRLWREGLGGSRRREGKWRVCLVRWEDGVWGRGG